MNLERDLTLNSNNNRQRLSGEATCCSIAASTRGENILKGDRFNLSREHCRETHRNIINDWGFRQSISRLSPVASQSQTIFRGFYPKMIFIGTSDNCGSTLCKSSVVTS